MPWTELAHASQAYVHVHIDRTRSLVRLTRTALIMAKEQTAPLLEQFTSEMLRLLPRSTRATQRLLFDTREAPKLADPATEAALLAVLPHTVRDQAQALPVQTHALTHKDLHLHTWRVTLPARQPPHCEGRWVAATDWPSLGLPAPIRVLLQET